MAKQSLYKGLWIRLIISFVLLLLIAFCVGVIFWGSNSSSTDIALALLAGISALVGIGQWLFPTSSEKPNQLRLPYARQLVRESASFRMGDTSAANFDYIIEPVMMAYDTAKRVLRESSDGVGSKHGILVLGAANVGKTRLAFEALTQTLPDWNVFLWNSTYDSLSKVPLLTISRRSGLVVFIDDLQEYVPPDNYNADGSVFIPDNRIATLQAFLNNTLMTQQLVVVATCRLEDEIRVGARLRWLFEQLEIITLRNFLVETSNPETANIINLFQQHGSAHIGDWDGTLGSLVLGLSKKRSQYEDLVQSHNPAVIVLRAMKLLSFAFITAHTTIRIQGVCTDVFGESTLQEGSQTWQDAIDLLTRLEFLSEVKDQANSGFVLVIRKDAYFDKVIIDYPALNRPYQLDQHFEQLQKVFVRLHDISALVSLANMFGFLKRYDEALVAFEQAIRLDPNYAVAYNDKGVILSTLRRNDEALIAYEEAIHLDSTNAHTYSNKGNALVNLKRNDEALVAFEQAIRLDPNYAAVYLGKGSAFGILKRNDEALVAFEQAIRLNPNYAAAYNNKASALASLDLHEEALTACEEAIRLDPNYAAPYIGKGNILSEFKRYDEALVAYEAAIHLDPNFAGTYINKGSTLSTLGRYEEALAAYGQAIRLDPTDARAFIGIRKIFKVRGYEIEA